MAYVPPPRQGSGPPGSVPPPPGAYQSYTLGYNSGYAQPELSTPSMMVSNSTAVDNLRQVYGPPIHIPPPHPTAVLSQYPPPPQQIMHNVVPIFRQVPAPHTVTMVTQANNTSPLYSLPSSQQTVPSVPPGSSYNLPASQQTVPSIPPGSSYNLPASQQTVPSIPPGSTQPPLTTPPPMRVQLPLFKPPQHLQQVQQVQHMMQWQPDAGNQSPGNARRHAIPIVSPQGTIPAPGTQNQVTYQRTDAQNSMKITGSSQVAYHQKMENTAKISAVPPLAQNPMSPAALTKAPVTTVSATTTTTSASIFKSITATPASKRMFQAPTVRASGRASPASPTETEQDDLYMRFAEVLKEGCVEATDERILTVFIGLSTFERKLVLGSGSIKGFLAKCDVIDVSGNTLSLNRERYKARKQMVQAAKDRVKPTETAQTLRGMPEEPSTTGLKTPRELLKERTPTPVPSESDSSCPPSPTFPSIRNLPAIDVPSTSANDIAVVTTVAMVTTAVTTVISSVVTPGQTVTSSGLGAGRNTLDGDEALDDSFVSAEEELAKGDHVAVTKSDVAQAKCDVIQTNDVGEVVDVIKTEEGVIKTEDAVNKSIVPNGGVTLNSDVIISSDLNGAEGRDITDDDISDISDIEPSEPAPKRCSRSLEDIDDFSSDDDFTPDVAKSEALEVSDKVSTTNPARDIPSATLTSGWSMVDDEAVPAIHAVGVLAQKDSDQESAAQTSTELKSQLESPQVAAAVIDNKPPSLDAKVAEFVPSSPRVTASASPTVSGSPAPDLKSSESSTQQKDQVSRSSSVDSFSCLNVSAPEFSPRTEAQKNHQKSESPQLNATAQEFSPKADKSVQAVPFKPATAVQAGMQWIPCQSTFPLLQDSAIECKRDSISPAGAAGDLGMGPAWAPLTWKPVPTPPTVTRLTCSRPPMVVGTPAERPPPVKHHQEVKTHKVIHITTKEPLPRFRVQDTQTEGVPKTVAASQTKTPKLRTWDAQTESCDLRDVAVNTLESMQGGDPWERYEVPTSWDDGLDNQRGKALPTECREVAANTAKDVLCVDVSNLDLAEDKFLLKYRESAHLMAVICGKRKLSGLLGMDGEKQWPNDLPYLSDDQKAVVQQECVNLRALLVSLRESLDHLEKKVDQVEDAAKKKKKKKKKSSLLAIKPTVAPDRTVTRWELEDFLENLLSVSVIEEVRCKFKKHLEKRGQPEEEEPEDSISKPSKKKVSPEKPVRAGRKSSQSESSTDTKSSTPSLERKTSDEMSSVFSSDESRRSSVDPEKEVGGKTETASAERVPAGDEFTKKLQDMSIEKLLSLSSPTSIEESTAALPVASQSADLSPSVTTPVAPSTVEPSASSQAPSEPSTTERGLGAALLDMTNSTPGVDPNQLQPAVSPKHANQASTLQDSLSQLAQLQASNQLVQTSQAVGVGGGGGEDQGALIQQMMMTLMQFNPTLASNPVLLQMTAVQHLHTMQQLQHTMTSANSVAVASQNIQQNFLLQGLLGGNQAAANQAQQNPMLQAMMGGGNQAANQMQQNNLLQSMMGGAQAANQMQQNPFMQAQMGGTQVINQQNPLLQGMMGSTQAANQMQQNNLLQNLMTGNQANQAANQNPLLNMMAGYQGLSTSLESGTSSPDKPSVLGQVASSASRSDPSPRATNATPPGMAEMTNTFSGSHRVNIRTRSESTGSSQSGAESKGARSRSSSGIDLQSSLNSESARSSFTPPPTAWNKPIERARVSSSASSPRDSPSSSGRNSPVPGLSKASMDPNWRSKNHVERDWWFDNGEEGAYKPFVPPRMRDRATSGDYQPRPVRNLDDQLSKSERFYVPPARRGPDPQAMHGSAPQARRRATSEGEALRPTTPGSWQAGSSARSPPDLRPKLPGAGLNGRKSPGAGLDGRKSPNEQNPFSVKKSPRTPEDAGWTVAVSKKQRAKQGKVGSGRIRAASSSSGRISPAASNMITPTPTQPVPSFNQEAKPNFNFGKWPQVGSPTTERKMTAGAPNAWRKVEGGGGIMTKQPTRENWDEEADPYVSNAFKWSASVQKLPLPKQQTKSTPTSRGFGHGLDSLDKF